MILVPERQLSVVCPECAEKNEARKELEEEESFLPSLFPGTLHAAIDTDPGFRREFLELRAARKARGER
jgi:hypothetical protein